LGKAAPAERGAAAVSGRAETATVAASEGPLRLDRWFKRHYPGLGHGRLEKLLRTGQIRVDGRRARASDRLAAGQQIRVPPLAEPPRENTRPIAPEDAARLQRLVLHRDAAVIVLDKPSGLAVQGGTRAERHLDGLLDALRFDCDERPRLVHRLDKETSGVLVIARTAAAAAFLARAFRDRAAGKLYWALVAGRPQAAAGRVDLALAKGLRKGGERVRPDAEEGKRAISRYRVVDSAGERASWLALVPLTGRTHQLRAHCAAIGAPIVGDFKYGGAAAELAGLPATRQLHLHARALVLPHPLGGTLRVTAPLPPHMRQSWAFFGFAEDEEASFAALEAVG
jgi:23S rRNA pseudouridine955/2504/2580 synthase